MLETFPIIYRLGMSNDLYPESKHDATSCSFCGKTLGKEYFFTCHVCGATYCYIHMYRHGKAHRPQAADTTPIVA